MYRETSTHARWPGWGKRAGSRAARGWEAPAAMKNNVGLVRKGVKVDGDELRCGQVSCLGRSQNCCCRSQRRLASPRR